MIHRRTAGYLTMLAHGLAICPRKFRPEGTDAVVQFLYLRLPKYRTRGLRLQAIHKRRKEVDVFCLDSCKLVIILR